MFSLTTEWQTEDPWRNVEHIDVNTLTGQTHSPMAPSDPNDIVTPAGQCMKPNG